MSDQSVIYGDGRAIASAAIPQKPVPFGPWLGSMRSRPPDRVPREYATSGSDFLYMPRYGYWRRRGGQTQKFDTFGAAAGMLPAKWGAKSRWADEYIGVVSNDGIPSVMDLLTKESVAAGVLDDGRFSQLWVRDQVGNLNYTLGSEYSGTTYPAPGDMQSLRFVPLWYDSGEGGITRGIDEFSRRFFFGGSRRFLKVGNWTYFPSVLGTPSRWEVSNESFTVPSTVYTANSDVTPVDTEWGRYGSGVFPTNYQNIATIDDSTSFLGRHGDFGTYHCVMGLNNTVSPSAASFTVTYRARYEGNAPSAGSRFRFGIGDNDGQIRFSGYVDATTLTTSWVTGTIAITAASIGGAVADNSIDLNAEVVIFFDGYIEITYVSIAETGAGTTSTRTANRLIPSGPIPSTHAGSLASGNAVAGSSGTTFVRPDADVTDGAWLNSAGNGTDLFSYIDEAFTTTAVSDADYIVDADSPGALCEVGLTDPLFVPTSTTHRVIMSFRASGNTLAAVPTLSVALQENATTTRATAAFTAAQLTTGGAMNGRWVTYELTAAQIDAFTAVTGWNNLTLEFTAGGLGGVRVYYAALEIIAVGQALIGGWRGKDRFFYSVAYRFEDDSVWMPTIPRFPNSISTSGYNLFTVDVANTETSFDKVVWSNIPCGPHGTKSRFLLRTPKIDSATDDNLQLDQFDLREVTEILDNVTTTYDDYFADDDSLTIDPGRDGTDKNGFFIRFDHMMPPRCRYIAGGDMRVIHSYGGTNPCAIVIAPVGCTADYDLNATDDTASLYNADASFMSVVIDSSGNGSLALIQSDGTTVSSTLVLAFTTYNTIQKLVDRINLTSCAVDGQQWRAQICPGQNPDVACLTALCPHSRALTTCQITSGQSRIDRAAGGLNDIPVGMFISNANFPAGTYVTGITSDTRVTTSAAATGTDAASTVIFYVKVGDSISSSTNLGYQRVISNSLPGFIYFNKTYLATDTFDKSATWMTTASPGSNKSAPNNFTTKLSNRFTPPLDAGASQGAAAVDQGFRLFYTNKRGVIRNTTQSEQGSGIDEDYRLLIVNHSSGCCAWNTVAGDGKFAIGLAPEGLIAGDLDREVLLTEAIWQHGASEGTSGSSRGDFSYEIPLCVAATARDIDVDVAATTITAYASARIMRSAIYVNYRQPSGSPVRPDRQIVYDFSSGSDVSGLAALMRSRTEPWGWSVPLVRAFTAMTEGRRSDGAHLYGWNDANAGSTGDGRIDEFETGDTDNGTAIAASVDLPIFRVGSNKMSVQEFTVEHLSLTGSTGSFTFHRSVATVGGTGDAYTLTPSTAGATVEYVRDVKQLTLPARSATEAFYWTYSQATGSARELRHVEFRLKSLPSYR